MPDAFFASSSKKRKRPSSSSSQGASNKTARVGKGRGKDTRPKNSAAPKNGASRPRRRRGGDEELDSGSDVGGGGADDDLRAEDAEDAAGSGAEDTRETPAEKRLRLARIYLESVKEDLARGEGEFDAAEVDREIISARLKEDVLENAGKLHIFIADSLALGDDAPPRCLRIKGHRLAVTAAVLSHDAERLYVAGKEGAVSAWAVASGARLAHAPKVRREPAPGGGQEEKRRAGKGAPAGHTDEVLALALSGDGRFLASGGKDRVVGVWDVGEGSPGGLSWVKSFPGHKDTISALSFRKSTNTLYTASTDRTLKLFDLAPGIMGFVETLFGHQDAVAGLDSLRGDTAVSCGARDRTCRFWKIADETQLVFRGGGAGKSRARDMLEGVLEGEEEGDEGDAEKAPKGKQKQKEGWVEGSVDCVAMVDEHTFVSGGDSGTISLWTTTKKKPVFTYPAAHGIEEVASSTEGVLRRPRWITSLACMRYADLFASGSWDSSIRLWRVEPSLRAFAAVGHVSAPGLVNSLQLVATPPGWAHDDAWGAGTGAVNGSAEAAPDAREGGALLVAGVGREPRLGRWIKLGAGEAVNAAMVFALRRRPSR